MNLLVTSPGAYLANQTAAGKANNSVEYKDNDEYICKYSYMLNGNDGNDNNNNINSQLILKVNCPGFDISKLPLDILIFNVLIHLDYPELNSFSWTNKCYYNLINNLSSNLIKYLKFKHNRYKLEKFFSSKFDFSTVNTNVQKNSVSIPTPIELYQKNILISLNLSLNYSNIFILSKLKILKFLNIKDSLNKNFKKLYNNYSDLKQLLIKRNILILNKRKLFILKKIKQLKVNVIDDLLKTFVKSYKYNASHKLHKINSNVKLKKSFFERLSSSS
ncbi:uncharacterized protein ASCRUDRAFT_5272 [Ascoidea rubescens DSM 1968]|uniref:F-box domain-containing protein n=1 Tax=Ascoidea rubescens DSM 1968 TaxID=1344418 RepID=A0A1D2VNU3_9ASCO|nr:hypothetical protein ASCRUDRAFT_5272 [Ascoidea rubescens DSM 1968]ODV63237.1 hypothetical protein ASCRUDRAFT_5272 [Ascoidea rubescens DSM 1968]